MAEAFQNLLEMTGIAEETNECWLFVIGGHDVGKTYMISENFAQLNDSQYKITNAQSTFGYEYSVINLQSETIVHIVETTDASPKNLVLSDLIKKHAKNACILVLFKANELNKANDAVEKYVIPLFEGSLTETQLGEDYQKYLTTYMSAEPISLPSDVMTANPTLPLFFVASFTDNYDGNNDIEFEGLMKYLREAAIPFGAGVATTKTESLLQLCVDCALRHKLAPETVENANVRSDYYLPPGWDSTPKLKTIETFALKESKESKTETTVKTAEEWQSFLGRLTEIKHKATSQEATPQKEDFWTQLE